MARGDDEALLQGLVTAAQRAGDAILQVVARGFDVERKGDQSPVTEADRAAELVILAALLELAPAIPVIAEEEVAAGRIPDHGTTFFLVDPLDGTKEFIRGGDDYTVNIGLIRDGVPVLGVVHSPATNRTHLGLVGAGAFLIEDGTRRPIACRPKQDPPVAVASKSHFSQPTADYLGALGSEEWISIGSSLKFCLVAEGRADIYPRLAPTCEWDTAAGHAVLLAAGGRVDAPEGGPLPYGKKAFFNHGFCATSGWEAPAIGPFMEPFSGGGDLPEGV